MKVKRSDRDGIAQITIDNPPVNAFGAAVRQGVLTHLKEALADPSIDGIVLTCAGRTFVAGADISEFDGPELLPSWGEVMSAIEYADKPVVAAMHGTALGGGLELALVCHYRVATAETRLGLPEIKLGLLPGSGGTQRLPRAVGIELAVRMILGGEPIPAGEALGAGLIDEIVEKPDTGGDAFVRKVLSERRPLRRLRNDDSLLEPARKDRAILTNAVAVMTRRAGASVAPFVAAEVIEGVLDLTFEEGLKRELAAFAKLVDGDQSKAQRYAFFAEREARNVPGMPRDTTPRPVDHVAIVGAGTMGGGIAMSFANAGIPVTLIDTSEEQLQRGLATIRKNWDATAARGGIPADAPSKRMALVTGAVGLENVAGADLVIEAVFETLAVKREVFEQLDRHAKAGAVLASNTSYLDINAIAQHTSRPQDVLGMHFFSPANVMKLCEIVRAEATAQDTLMTAVSVARKIGKIPVVVGVCDGFVGNRMLGARDTQADTLLYDGVLPQRIDRVLTDFGMPMGPFAMTDLGGLDIGWRSRMDRGVRSEIADTLCEAGRFGQKSGKGYYLYQPGSRTPLPDPEVETIIRGVLARTGRTPRDVSDEEILERLIYPMVNEAAHILEEGIAARPSDIDVVWMYGYGWPAYRGGPIYWADRQGLDRIVKRLEDFARDTGDQSLQPAPLLRRLAAEGGSFASLTAQGSKT